MASPSNLAKSSLNKPADKLKKKKKKKKIFVFTSVTSF
jgi:hypothetical protein